jgi:hypothetical protein
MLIGWRNSPKLWRMPRARVRIRLDATSMTVKRFQRDKGKELSGLRERSREHSMSSHAVCYH